MAGSPNAPGRTTSRSTRSGSSELLRRAFFVLLGMWMVFPVLQSVSLPFAEDAVPFIVAGRLAADDPGAIYAHDDNPGIVDPAFIDEACPFMSAGFECEETGGSFVLPFISPPQAVPLVMVLAPLPDAAAQLAVRLLTAAGMAGGMWILWRRLATHRRAAPHLFATAALLTPFVYHVVAYGQNASLMFLSAALGLSGTERNRRAAGAGAIWVVQLVLKGFAFPLGVIALVRRRWRFLSWSIAMFAALTVAAAVIVPFEEWQRFLDISKDLTGTRIADSPTNLSVDASIHALWSGWGTDNGLFTPALLGRCLLVVGLFWWKLRDADEDLQWAYGWLALLFIHPQVWWHYYEVVVVVVAYVVATRRDPPWILVPLSALVVLPIGMISGHDALLQRTAPALLIVAAVGLPLLVQRPAPEPTPAPSPTPA